MKDILAELYLLGPSGWGARSRLRMPVPWETYWISTAKSRNAARTCATAYLGLPPSRALHIYMGVVYGKVLNAALFTGQQAYSWELTMCTRLSVHVPRKNLAARGYAHMLQHNAGVLV